MHITGVLQVYYRCITGITVPYIFKESHSHTDVLVVEFTKAPPSPTAPPQNSRW